ncbi:MAG: hypothetical protein GX892_15125 [Thermoanaerobacteraceae bacterium]|nr:hypothetical protein [Thermoanaerobacteraceae bacterium]
MILIFTLFDDPIIRSVISGCVAALFSYYINSKALKSAGEKVIINLAPILEELFKTGFALVLKGKVLLSHVTFGVVEAAYDIWANGISTAYWAGFASIISHSVFGAISQYFIYRTDNNFLGIAIAALIHMAWNYTVINLKNQH